MPLAFMNYQPIIDSTMKSTLALMLPHNDLLGSIQQTGSGVGPVTAWPYSCRGCQHGHHRPAAHLDMHRRQALCLLGMGMAKMTVVPLNLGRAWWCSS